jgi:hypothetical protein
MATQILQNARILLRGRTASEWTISNEILLAREKGLELDTGKEKVGDGVTPWNDLDYWEDGAGGGSGATDLSVVNRGASTLDIASSTGADATIPAATTSLTGLLTAGDKTKLDGIATGATANATDAQLRDRSTHTGTQAAGTITGLATVATTGAYADLSGRPTLGTAAAAATTDFAPATHNQAWSTITGTPTTRSGYGITDAAANGAVGSSGLTMSTARLLGRVTAGTGAIEEITLGAGLSFSGTTLNATGEALPLAATVYAFSIPGL